MALGIVLKILLKYNKMYLLHADQDFSNMW